MRLPRLKTVRVLTLLLVLCASAGVTAFQHHSSRSWTESLQVSIYPLNGDGSVKTAQYIDALDPEDFTLIDRWAAREAERHGLPLSAPVQVALGAPIDTLPPTLDENSSALQTLLWSLRFRWWAFRHTPDAHSLKRVRVFVVYQQGRPGEALAHSLGMAKGLMGLVNAFADDHQHEQNLIVIAHELLHTVGAEDKYNADGGPRWPEGYADPSLGQRRVQEDAEIMVGRRFGHQGLIMADSLQGVRLNEWTAREINWLD